MGLKYINIESNYSECFYNQEKCSEKSVKSQSIPQEF